MALNLGAHDRLMMRQSLYVLEALTQPRCPSRTPLHSSRTLLPLSSPSLRSLSCSSFSRLVMKCLLVAEFTSCLPSARGLIRSNSIEHCRTPKQSARPSHLAARVNPDCTAPGEACTTISDADDGAAARGGHASHGVPGPSRLRQVLYDGGGMSCRVSIIVTYHPTDISMISQDHRWKNEATAL